MADTKITSLLTPQVTTNPATDVLPIVNIADTSMASSGSTRKITVNTLLGAGGTATLASATITGDLTVDTSTLKVDSANNRVGILTATPAQSLDIASGNLQVRTGGTVFSDTFSNYGAALAINAAGSLPIRLQIGGTTAYEITSANVHTWSNVGGVAGTAMTLNSTGLGVGGSPNTGFLTVGSTSNVSATANALTILSQRATFVVTANGATDAAGTTINYAWANGGQGPLIFRNAAIANVMTLDSSGNVGIGITPSAWAAAVKALQIGAAAAVSYDGTNYDISSNRYLASGGTSTYIANGFATMARQVSGQHLWYNAPSGTAGNAITFTQAMTLDASGRLLVGGAAPFGIPNGAGTSFFPLIQTITTSGSAAVSAFVNDGTNNRRIGLFVDNDNGITGISVGRSGGSAPFVYRDATDERLRIDTFGNLITTVPTTPPTLAANSQMVFNLTSNTNLRISVRGTDGVTRTANLTLAP